MAKHKKELPKFDISTFIGAAVGKMSGNLTSEKSERKLGVSMLVTLAFSAYVLLAVLSTTDMMLLREGAIALPVIQVGVSIVAFYIIAPLLILLLHFNLLAKLTLYAREIYDSNSSTQAPRGAQGLFCKALIVLSSLEPKRLILEMKNENFTGVFIRLIFLIIFGDNPTICPADYPGTLSRLPRRGIHILSPIPDNI